MRIIGECGVNFKNIKEAKQMIFECKRVGIDYSKFQIYNEQLIESHPQKEFLKSIMLNKEKCKELFEYGKSINQPVFFSVMFLEAVNWCEEIGVNYYKIRCNDNYNYDLIQKIKKTGKKYFTSVSGFYQQQKYDLGDELLYCVPKYPAKIIDYYDIIRYDNDWDGISDHTSCTCLLQLAIEHDIKYFEKHVKLDGTTPLENDWSVSFSELKEVLT